MTESHNFLSHLSELPHRHHWSWNNLLFSSIILYWQNLEHLAVFYFRHKNGPSCQKCGIKFTICAERTENMDWPSVWRSCGSTVGLVPHIFLKSCKYPVLKYSYANGKLNCSLLQGLKGWCRFTERYKSSLLVCGVTKWKGCIKFK